MTQPALDHLGAPGLRAFFNIAEQWRLSDLQQAAILGISELSTLQKCKSAAKAREEVSLGTETLDRIGLVLGIFRAINVLLPDPGRADSWMHAPNDAPVFRGCSPIELMTDNSSNGLKLMHRYLIAECGGFNEEK